MKLLILSCCLAVACADVAHILAKKSESQDSQAQILRYEQDVGLEGKFEYAFETNNGISHQGHGELKDPNAENPIQHMAGSGSWVDPNGEVVSYQYSADENGYQATGSHIPTPPPIPEYILRSLEWIAAHPPKPEPQQYAKLG